MQVCYPLCFHFPHINMVAEALVSPIVELLLGKLGSFVNQQVSLISGVKNDLEKLKTTLTTIKTGLLDAEKQQIHNSQVGDWLEKLKDVCYDAEDLFEEFQAEALRRQVLAEHGSIPKKVCNALSWPKSLAFRFNIGHKIKELRERLDEIATNQTKFGFTNRVENRINYIPRQRETHSFVVASEIIGREKDKEEVRYLSFVEDNMIRDGVPSFLSNTYLRTIYFPLHSVRPNQSFVESCISLFPFLRYLDLSFGSFVSVPKKLGNLRHLRYLNLGRNGKIKKLPNSICKLQSLQTLRLGGCEELQELPRDIRYLISLRFLELTTNQKILPHNGIGRLNSLRRLTIISCNNLEYLVEDIGNLKALQTLFIVTCSNLVSLPSSIKRLSSLEELYLWDCEKLNLDWGMGTEEEDTHQDLNGTRPHLRALGLSELPQLVELPQWLLRCSANTLQLLIIEECPNVASMQQDMHGLTALNKIEIVGCPTLGESCKEGSGEDWPQIAHVPNIRLDGDLIINEENVYFLCKKLCANGVADADGSDLYVVFISNEKKQAYPTVASKGKQEQMVLFSGIIMLFAFSYYRNNLRSTGVHVQQLQIKENKSVFHLSQKTDLLGIRFFCIVHAPIFLRFFAFDRRHMKDPTGNWIAEPPSYEPIVAEDNNVHNLNEYIEIRTKDISTNVGAKLINGVSNKKLGVAMNENQLEEFFSKSLNEF
ncbi:hypothetical protein EZV62_028297 [Acer yangbiense]|uniref:Uncharacterized protein n=1 Tax=Acer yangbiense TaxID=1000413 RepID=A0A5C7GPG6_9ROSI|nr:hypothetical protein EZV62_028297 [Acer yangbiense]